MGEGRIKKNVVSADVPVIAGPRTYEEFRAQRGAPLCVARAEVPESGLPTPWWPDHKIVPGVRSGVELCDWLERRVDVERAPLESASQTSIWSMRRSIEENLGVDGSELEFAFYRILPTDRNAPYLVEGECVRIGIFEPYALAELTTARMETTSNLLFSEWVVERGVSEGDLAEKTVALANYLFHLRRLEQPGWEGL